MVLRNNYQWIPLCLKKFTSMSCFISLAVIDEDSLLYLLIYLSRLLLKRADLGNRKWERGRAGPGLALRLYYRLILLTSNIRCEGRVPRIVILSRQTVKPLRYEQQLQLSQLVRSFFEEAGVYVQSTFKLYQCIQPFTKCD